MFRFSIIEMIYKDTKLSKRGAVENKTQTNKTLKYIMVKIIISLFRMFITHLPWTEFINL